MRDKNLFKCRCCGVEMATKRPGSRQFFGGASDRPDHQSEMFPDTVVPGSFLSQQYLDSLHSLSLGEEIVDRGRRANPREPAGWEVDEDSPEHNFTVIYWTREGLPMKSRAWRVRQEDGKDLSIRVSIFDRKPESSRDAARRYLELIRKLTPQELEIHLCYLSDGHDWELIAPAGEPEREVA